MEQINHVPFNGSVEKSGRNFTGSPFIPHATDRIAGDRAYRADQVPMNGPADTFLDTKHPDTVSNLHDETLHALASLNKTLASMLDAIAGGIKAESNEKQVERPKLTLLAQSQEILAMARWANEQVGRIAGNLL